MSKQTAWNNMCEKADIEQVHNLGLNHFHLYNRIQRNSIQILRPYLGQT